MIESAIKNRKIVFYLLFVVFVGGIYSYFAMPKQEAPDLMAPVARLTCIYPGASREDVDQFVTSKIEEELMNMEAFDYCNSYTYNSVTTVIVFMKYGSDTDKVWTELRRNLSDLQEDLPDEVLLIDVNTNLVDTAGMIISLTGEGYDYDELGFYGRKIIKELKAIDGVTRFEMVGEIGKEVEILIDSEEMNRLNLSYEELSGLLKAQNLEIPSGSIETEGEDIPLRIKGSYTSLLDIENIILDVSRDNYSVLKLKDIANISFKDESAATVYLRDGREAVLLVGYFENDRNVLDVGKDVRNSIDEIKTELPGNLIFEEVVFQPAEVDRSISSFISNLALGIGLVIIVVFFGMGLRNAIIVSLAIPTSILATLLMMPIFNVKIHAISIAAFIVALGMLVDNAIVVGDSIQNKLDDGVEHLKACVEGTREVITSILTSTLTTVAAFSPLILLSSLAGDYIKALPQVVIMSLSASFVFAFLVTPSLAFVFFKKKPSHKIKQRKTIMQYLLEFGMRKKLVSFLVGIILISALGSTFYFLNIIFFPKADKTIMYIDIQAEKNIDTAYTKQVTDQIEAILATEPGILHYTTAIGGAVPKYYDTLGIYPEIPENAQIVMEVDITKTDHIKNTPFAKELQNRIDIELVGGFATVKELEYAEPISAPILIRLSGDDMDLLWEVTSDLEGELKGIDGTLNVRTDYAPYVYEYQLDLDEERLSYYGLMKYDVLNEVSIALRGRDVSVFRSNGEEYNINITGDTKSVEGIEQLMIKSSATGNKHMLKDLGEVELIKVRQSLEKYNGDSSIVLMCDVDNGFDTGTIEKEFKNRVAMYNFGEVEMTFDGESQKIMVYFGNLGFSAVFAVIMILTILLIQFKNFKQALIIMLTLPLSAAGAIFGLFIMNQPVSFTGLLGIISLIGIVVNNAIVLMEYINMKRKQGLSVDETAITASVVRFRPIMLSTITTVIGLLPLMFSNSELFKPMSVSLVFGLLVSTVLTLVFIPLTYSLVYHNEDR